MREVTLEELKSKLADMEETYLLELLQLRSQDLVDRFGDLIEDRYDELIGELEEIEDNDNRNDS